MYSHSQLPKHTRGFDCIYVDHIRFINWEKLAGNQCACRLMRQAERPRVHQSSAFVSESKLLLLATEAILKTSIENEGRERVVRMASACDFDGWLHVPPRSRSSLSHRSRRKPRWSIISLLRCVVSKVCRRTRLHVAHPSLLIHRVLLHSSPLLSPRSSQRKGAGPAAPSGLRI